MKHICVVGAGTVGLSVAYKILEELDGKVKVTVIAESFMHQTTSIGSGGLWEPYQISGTPDELVNKWGLVSFNHFLKLYYSVHAKEAGTQLMNAYSLYTEEECLNLNEPSWKDIVFNFKVMTTSEIRRMMLPERFVKAFSFSTIVVDQKYYMQYLTNILKKGGVEFIQRKLNSLDELDHETFDAIVNCTGLGSAKLLDDSEMYPIRGQVLRVKAPWMKNVMFWEKSYIIPNIDTVVLGGTADKGEWDTSPSLKCTERILNDICEVFPSFRDCVLENVWVGLRPGRTPLRLEMEKKLIRFNSEEKLRPIFHCYGHGGSGITLAMGCAEDLVINLLKPALYQVLIDSELAK